MLRKNEMGFIHRLQLRAARQIAFDLCRLSVPKTSVSQPGKVKKAVLHGRLWVCYLVLG